jgi:hypothetical protein
MNGKPRVSVVHQQSAPSAAYTPIALEFRYQANHHANRDLDHRPQALGIPGISDDLNLKAIGGWVSTLYCVILLAGLTPQFSPAKAACPAPSSNPKAAVPAGAINNILTPGGALTPYTKMSMRGTLTGALGPNPADPYARLITPFTQVAVTDDTATRVGPGSGIPAFAIYHKFGGAGSGGGARMGIWSDVVQDGDLPGNASPFQTGIFSNVWAKSGANGGAYYGFAAQVIDDIGAGHYGSVGGEINVALHAAGTLIKEGWGVGSVPLTSGPDLYQGVNYSAGYGLWAGGSCGNGKLAGGSACAGYTTGISFGRSDSYWPIADDGTIIAATQGVGVQTKMKAAHGLYWPQVTFGEDSINVPGFRISPTGNPILTANFPTIVFNDMGSTPVSGGLARLTGDGAGTYLWRINTAVAADFSTGVDDLKMGLAGVEFPNGVVGNVVIKGPPPTIASGFGSGASIVGNSAVGRVTVGVGGASSGVLTFITPYTINAPVCSVWDETTNSAMRPTPTLTQLTITGTMTAADKIIYDCKGFL